MYLHCLLYSPPGVLLTFFSFLQNSKSIEEVRVFFAFHRRFTARAKILTLKRACLFFFCSEAYRGAFGLREREGSARRQTQTGVC